MANEGFGDLILAAVLGWAFIFIWAGTALIARRDDRRAKILGGLAVIVGLVPGMVVLVMSSLEQGLALVW